MLRIATITATALRAQPQILRAPSQILCRSAPALSTVSRSRWTVGRQSDALGSRFLAGVRARGLSTAVAENEADEADDSWVAEIAKRRNFSVIAHVDHGKTTLVDKILEEGQEELQGERVMDGMDLEKERGITITSKPTSLEWEGKVLNIVDTPGHADFGGEVERVLGMVDGAIVLVDAFEGVQAQTKFVLTKALEQGLKPILVMNKVDRPEVDEEQCGVVETQVFDFLASVGACDETLDFPTVYASAKQGWTALSFAEAKEAMKKVANGEKGSMVPLLKTIVDHVPPPRVSQGANDPFKMLVTMVEQDNYMGRLVIGLVTSGRVTINDRVSALTFPDAELKTHPQQGARVVKVWRKKGVQRLEIPGAIAGDIVALAGIPEATVTDTIASIGVNEALKTIPIDPPTISMSFRVNDSPLQGKEGTQLTGSKIQERLLSEAETNVALKILSPEEQKNATEEFEVQGRGELHLGILIETMRREGFELTISPPTVLYKEDANGKKLEPIEDVTIDVDEEFVGYVMEEMGKRNANLLEMINLDDGENRQRLTFTAPSRGLIGFRGQFANKTRGQGIMQRAFKGYEPFRGPLQKLRMGALLSCGVGKTTTYALEKIEPRGSLFIGPGTQVYPGMIIGEHSRADTCEVNPVKTKKLTNVRAVAAEELTRLIPPIEMGLEDCIGYMAEDECLEVTPSALRLRKNPAYKLKNTNAVKTGNWGKN